jgi:hypothetical protein
MIADRRLCNLHCYHARTLWRALTANPVTQSDWEGGQLQSDWQVGSSVQQLNPMASLKALAKCCNLSRRIGFPIPALAKCNWLCAIIVSRFELEHTGHRGATLIHDRLDTQSCIARRPQLDG